MLRRRLLHGAFASASVFSFAAALESARAVAAEGHTSVRLGYVGNPCEAATYTAPGSSIFRRHDLAAVLVPFRSDAALVAALGAGKIEAASVTLPALLEPLESRAGVRVVAGLHAGCLRVVAPEDVIMRTNGNLKGAKIATDRLHGPSMKLLSALLRKGGIDPRHDVTWRVLTASELEGALASKAVDCVAASDPLGYLLLADKSAEPYLNAAEGGFACGNGIGGGHHCFLALSSALVAMRPAVASSLTRAYLESTTDIGRGVGPAALASVRGGYTYADLATTIGMLSSYDWTTTTDFVPEEVELTAHDFRRAGLLKASTDPEGLAERAYADVLHA